MAGVINSIRSKGTMLMIIIGLAMVTFIMTDFLSQIYMVVYGGEIQRDEVGRIGGKKVAYTEYVERLKEEMESAARADKDGIDDAQRQQIANQVWEKFVIERTFGEEYRTLGIEVTDAELKDMLTGPDPDPQAVQWFGGKENVSVAYSQAAKNPQLREQLRQIEEYLVTSKQQNKYSALLRNGTFVSKAEAARKYKDENTKYNITFLAVNYNALPDSAVKLTEADFTQYYQENIEQFKQPRKEAIIKYVLFPKTPTRRDTLSTLEMLEGLKKEFSLAEDDSAYAAARSNSDYVPPSVIQNPADLDSITKARIKGVSVDSVVGPFLDGKSAKLIKVAEKRSDPARPFVKVRHILITPKGSKAEDTTEALTKAVNIKLQLEGDKSKFGELATSESQDQKTKFSGGDLGWYKYGTYGEDFDAAVAKAEKNKILGPLKSKAGFHIYEVTDRSVDGIRLATIVYDIEPSGQTLDSLRKLADGFIRDVGGNGAMFDSAAKKKGYQIQYSQPISSGMSYIAGIQGTGATTAIARWALNGKEGQVCDRHFDADNALVVATIHQLNEEGYKPLAKVKDQITSKVAEKAKAKLILEKLSKIPSGELEAMRNAYGQGAFVSKADNISFLSSYVPGVGNDPKLIGAIFKLKKGQTSKPIVGSTGVYIVKVEDVAEAQPQDEKAAEEYRKNLQTSKRSQILNKVNQALRDYAQIKDYRYNFE
ncbi:MAG: peptidylprolyl isomerase [Bacteroidia bacterium]|nr:peptidylprolyl isomerase [Bacteroidia bacterium]MDW8333734.1 peptidylprolyl isomerase [Bacteroidia bacterium]